MMKRLNINRKISATAQNALKEAKERENLRGKKQLPKELGGREGPEPTRYGDWEKKGIISDF